MAKEVPVDKPEATTSLIRWSPRLLQSARDRKHERTYILYRIDIDMINKIVIDCCFMFFPPKRCVAKAAVVRLVGIGCPSCITVELRQVGPNLSSQLLPEKMPFAMFHKFGDCLFNLCPRKTHSNLTRPSSHLSFLFSFMFMYS